MLLQHRSQCVQRSAAMTMTTTEGAGVTVLTAEAREGNHFLWSLTIAICICHYCHQPIVCQIGFRWNCELCSKTVKVILKLLH